MVSYHQEELLSFYYSYITQRSTLFMEFICDQLASYIKTNKTCPKIISVVIMLIHFHVMFCLKMSHPHFNHNINLNDCIRNTTTQWRIQDFPRGGVHPLVKGVDLRCGHFLVKMYAKTKELGPIGGDVCRARPLDPPTLRYVT